MSPAPAERCAYATIRRAACEFEARNAGICVWAVNLKIAKEKHFQRFVPCETTFYEILLSHNECCILIGFISSLPSFGRTLLRRCVACSENILHLIQNLMEPKPIMEWHTIQAFHRRTVSTLRYLQRAFIACDLEDAFNLFALCFQPKRICLPYQSFWTPIPNRIDLMNLKPKYYTEDMDALLLCSTEFALSPLVTPQK